MTDDVTHDYAPRSHFIPYHQREKRWSCLVMHRRAGKTVAAVNDLVARALYTPKKNARYAYIGPYYGQTKDIAWTYLKEATKTGLAKRTSESELSVTLINDARIRLYGADNPDALRGIYLDGVVLDEFGDMRPTLWGQVILPTLADRGGWATVMGTAKGKNQFYLALERAKKDPDWFWMVGKASETRILSDEILRQMRAQMSEEEYAQEYECDFNAAVQGTYYASLIATLEADPRGRISRTIEWDPEFPVEVAADLGRTDSCAWWFWQNRPDGVAFIDYSEDSGKGIQHYIDMLIMKPYKYETVWLPHDAKAKTLATERSTIEQVLQSGLPARIAPKLSIQDGIEASRLMLRDHAWFNSHTCALGLEALRAYHRDWSEIAKCFSDTPKHDWSSNGADAFRYASLVAKGGSLIPESLDLDKMRKSYPFSLDELFRDNERRMGRYQRIG